MAVHIGARVAELVGQERAYTPSEVSNWEKEQRPVPPLVELALIRAGLYVIPRVTAKKKRSRA